VAGGGRRRYKGANNLDIVDVDPAGGEAHGVVGVPETGGEIVEMRRCDRGSDQRHQRRDPRQLLVRQAFGLVEAVTQPCPVRRRHHTQAGHRSYLAVTAI